LLNFVDLVTIDTAWVVFEEAIPKLPLPDPDRCPTSSKEFELLRDFWCDVSKINEQCVASCYVESNISTLIHDTLTHVPDFQYIEIVG
jgi:hypothetical protein